MFVFVLDNSTHLLRKIVDVVREITNDQKVMFEIDDRGLVLQAVDFGRVCVLSLYLGPTCFKKFETDRSIVCLSIAMLLKVLKCSAVESEPELEMSWDGKADHVSVKTPTTHAVFELPLFHAGESERFELPEPECGLSFDSNDLARTIKDLAMFSDTATFSSGKSLGVSVCNATGVRASLRLVPKSACVPGETKEPATRATFALSYLTSMVKAAALSDTLAIELQRDRPLTMEVALLSGRGYLRMYLAPKVDDGEGNESENENED
jgi:proliferating cell nuclear antigen PCNA